MEQIINYIDNIFENLPKTKTILELKEDLLSNMEDKYNELIRNGNSKNEAIGIVISEFGNVEELIGEFDLKSEDEGEDEEVPALTLNNVDDYLEINKKASILFGLGIVFSMLGVALLISIYQLIADGFISGFSKSSSFMVGLIPLFLFIAIAAGMFIYAVIIINKYKDIEYNFILPPLVRKYIEDKNNSFHQSFTRSTIISVILCILSPISFLISTLFDGYSTSYGVVGLLLFISVAVYIFIYYGGIKLSYSTLLKVGTYTKSTKKFVNAVASIMFPSAVVIFLVSGLVFHQWYINWIVFPITGILYGIFTEVYKIMKEKKS